MSVRSRAALTRFAGALSAAVIVTLILHHRMVTVGQTTIAPGFTDSVVLSGLEMPTVLAFAPDGRIFVGEKSGIVKVFDSLSDPAPTVFADLRTQVYNHLDRGLLGLAVDPGFPGRPYIYVLYVRDAPIGGTAPRWGTPGATNDPCPDPPGYDDGCLASGRLSRLEAAGGGSVWTGTEKVLIDDWFQQFDSHSMGSLVFGPDGALYASGGDAASWQFVDYGQEGEPRNPAGDPPVPVGGVQTPPSAEGGALRPQDLRTDGDPVGLNGTVIRISPDTGAAMPDNPLFWHADPNARRILAYGLRNPFRVTLRPGTKEAWVGDVGWRLHEEIDVIPDPSQGIVKNFGWPCYDGTTRQPGYDAADLTICEQLYADPSPLSFAYFQYREGVRVVTDEPCGFTNSSISGLAFYPGGSYPDEYDGALFFADYTRKCMWVMPAGANGLPDPARRRTFIANAANPVDLKIGPGGDLYYVDITGGAIRRIRYTAGNQAPVAAIDASTTSGPTPLTVSFNGGRSVDPEGGALTYTWDLNGDGAFGDSTIASPSHTYSVKGTFTVRLRVADDVGMQDEETVTIVAGNSAPAAVIDTPAEGFRWRADQTYTFSGRGSDPEDGALPSTSLHWAVVLNHCSSATSCHEHFLQEYPGVASGTFSGVDHEYPSYLALRLTVTDSGGLKHTAVRRLDPQSVVVTFDTRPSGLQLALGASTFTTPASRTLIVGSNNSVSAPSPQTLSGASYAFTSWSDGGTQTHQFKAPDAPASLVATFGVAPSTLPGGWASRDIGTVGVPGAASYSTGVYTVRGAGADVWGTADGLHYAYQAISGDTTIYARVTGVQGTEPWTKVGVMIRETLTPGSAHAFLLVSTSRGISFQRRTTTGGLSTATTITGTAPRWVKLERRGNVITALVSTDGAAWTTVGSATFTMTAAAHVGLAVTSHDTSQLATGTFDTVGIIYGDAPPPPPPPPPPPDSGEIVLYAGKASVKAGAWHAVNDATAAGGVRMSHPDAAAARVATPLAAPMDYFDLTFAAQAGKPYRLWIRAKADANGWANDSVHVQFSGSVTSSGTPQWRIGTTGGTQVNLEDCSGCGLAGWGWQDNGYGAGVMGPLVYFAEAGTQTIRVQTREDGLSIDQIVLSPATYLSASPGTLKNDTTILAEAGGGGGGDTPPPPPPPPALGDVVLYASEAPVRAGAWTIVPDTTAAGGARLRLPDAAAAKVMAPVAAPANYFEMTFNAEAGKAYRIWIRAKADNNHWANDSVWVQFSGAVTSSGAPQWRIGTTAGTEINLEDCSGCGLAGWGWQDNGYGAGVLGPTVYFAATGTQTLRVQQREDGVSIDQIVISWSTYLSSSPGALKNDAKILAKQ